MNMKLGIYFALIVCVAGIAGGQVLFKLAARTLESGTTFLNVLFSPYLLCGVALYGTTTLAWVWLLTKLPLTRAYPFMALSFIFVPLLSALILGEEIGPKYWLGIALIVGGLLITLRATPA